MNKIKSILFVCTGNSCRSVMAEGLLKKYLKEAGRNDIEVSSAGISAPENFPPTESTVEVMKLQGVNVSGHKSRNITPDIVRSADLILAMEDIHKEEVLRLVPEAAPKTHLLKEFGLESKKSDPEGIGIPDPIGKPGKDYQNSLNTIKKEIERIAKIL